MTPVNRGKDFEHIIRSAFEKVPNTSVIRLPDPTMGYLGVRNFCDFVVYHCPYQYFIECKTVHGNTLAFSNITDNQWYGLLEMSYIAGVRAGVLCWWVDKDVTRFIPIRNLQAMKNLGKKSVRYDDEAPYGCVDYIVDVVGEKKRVFFSYDMERFFDDIS